MTPLSPMDLNSVGSALLLGLLLCACETESIDSGAGGSAAGGMASGGGLASQTGGSSSSGGTSTGGASTGGESGMSTLPACPGCPVLGDRNAQGQTLVFSDEFEGDVLDRSVWKMETGMIRNQEEQCYVDRDENIVVKDGLLTIRGIPEAVDDPMCSREWEAGVVTPAKYSSASVTSKDVKFFKYGRLEARLKVPAAQGAWPAFWLRSQDAPYGGWPKSGEIDIMEFVSQTPQVIYGTVHYEFNGHKEDGGSIELAEPASANFHEIAVDWTPTQIDWTLDGQHFHSFNADQDIQGRRPFDETFYIILNLAVGGAWPEDPNPGDWPDEYQIDWVRVWQTR